MVQAKFVSLVSLYQFISVFPAIVLPTTVISSSYPRKDVFVFKFVLKPIQKIPIWDQFILDSIKKTPESNIEKKQRYTD